MESKRPASYSLVSDEQRAKLLEYYNQGMQSTLEIEKISNAVQDTGLPIQKVKKWIGNQNGKVQKRFTPETGSEFDGASIKRTKYDRKLTAQNVFYSRLSKEGKLSGFKTNGQRHIFMAKRWHELSNADKECYREEATRLNEKPVDLKEEDKIFLLKRQKKKLVNAIMELEQLGVESSCIISDENGDICYFGSRRGTDFLKSSPEIDLEYKKFFALKEKETENGFSYKDLQVVYNQSYAKAINCKNAKVPYLNGNFEIEGIPEGIAWRREDGRVKKPADYGQAQINKIMSVKENITFKLLTRAHENNVDISDEVNDKAVESAEHCAVESTLPVCFLKLVDEAVGKRALAGGARIEEDEVDTLLQLRDEEYEELIGAHAMYFTEDALECLKINYTALRKGVILATYTDNAEVFWLFYYKGLVAELENLSSNHSIPGYWLDKKKGTCYRLIHNSTSIKYRNIVKDINNNILSWRQKIEKNTKQVIVDQGFLDLVKSTLASHKLS